MSSTYMKDESGYCYTWTETLSTQKQLTPYDGAVDAAGFATEKQSKPKAGKPAKPTTDTVVEPVADVDPLDAALASSKLDE